MIYVSIDVETTGLDPETCQILEFGAVIEDTEKKLPLCELPTFQQYLFHNEIRGNAYALAMNQDILYKIARAKPGDLGICKPDLLGHNFARFLSRNGVPSGSITVAGKNFGAFDLQFLKRLPNFTPFPVAMKYRFLDPATLFFNPATDDAPPDLKTCCERAIDHQASIMVTHRAVDDAILVVAALREGLGY